MGKQIASRLLTSKNKEVIYTLITKGYFKNQWNLINQVLFEYFLKHGLYDMISRGEVNEEEE